jgi:hypothetical protein
MKNRICTSLIVLLYLTIMATESYACEIYYDPIAIIEDSSYYCNFASGGGGWFSSLSYDPDNGCSPGAGITYFEWWLWDGSNSYCIDYGQFMSSCYISFPNPGYYEVYLYVEDDDGSYDYTDEYPYDYYYYCVYVTAIGVASVSADKETADVGEDVMFTVATSPYDGLQAYVTKSWSGGGTPATGSDTTFTTNWSTLGLHTVTASIGNSNKQASSNIVNNAPTAEIYDPASGPIYIPVGSSLTFSGRCNDAEGNNVNYQWELANYDTFTQSYGPSGSGEPTLYTLWNNVNFSTAGYYGVYLLVKDNYHNWGVGQYINVYAFEVKITSPSQNQTFTINHDTMQSQTIVCQAKAMAGTHDVTTNVNLTTNWELLLSWSGGGTTYYTPGPTINDKFTSQNNPLSVYNTTGGDLAIQVSGTVQGNNYGPKNVTGVSIRIDADPSNPGNSNDNSDFITELGSDIIRALAWQEGAGSTGTPHWDKLNHYNTDTGQPLVNDAGAWGIMNIRKGVWESWFNTSGHTPSGYTVVKWNVIAWNWKTNIANGIYIHQTYMYDKQTTTQKTWTNTSADPATPNREDLASYGYFMSEATMQAVTSATWSSTVQSSTHVQNIRTFKSSKPWQ